jgi:uncharacterized membrane protein YcaP (DUF421 family)
MHDWYTFIRDLLRPEGSSLALAILGKVVRPVIVYLLMVAALRKFGKRILAQLNPFDLVVLLTLSNTVQNAIIGADNSLGGGVIGAAALLAVNAALVRIYYRGPGIDKRMMEERDIYLIRDFQVQEDALRELHINLGELTSKAHERGFDDLHEVQTAVLYPNGTIYMKGTSQDAACVRDILSELQALRQQIAAMRG